MTIERRYFAALDSAAERSDPAYYGPSRHGFVVRATSLPEAIANVEARARNDGFWGAGEWRALVRPIDAHGHTPIIIPEGRPDCWMPDITRVEVWLWDGGAEALAARDAE